MTTLRILDIGEGDAYEPIKDLLIGLRVKEKATRRHPFPQSNPLFRSGTFVLSLDDYHKVKKEGEKFTGTRGLAFSNCFGGGDGDREIYLLHVQVEQPLTKEQEAYAEIDQLDDLSGDPIKVPPRRRKRRSSRPQQTPLS